MSEVATLRAALATAEEEVKVSAGEIAAIKANPALNGGKDGADTAAPSAPAGVNETSSDVGEEGKRKKAKGWARL